MSLHESVLSVSKPVFIAATDVATLNAPMLAKHRDAVLALTPDAACRIWTRCRMKHPEFAAAVYEEMDTTTTDPDSKKPTPAALLVAALSSNLSHADLVLTLARELDPDATQALETLIGKPITRPAPPSPKQKLQRLREARGQTDKTTMKFDPTAVVQVLVPNPKRPGSDPHRRFNLYLPGEPIQSSLDAGVTPADVRWDLAHGFISLSGMNP